MISIKIKYTRLLALLAFMFIVNVSSAEVETMLESVTENTEESNSALMMNIGDLVWHDINGDGIQDTNEPGIGGVPVILFNELNDQVDSTTTSSTGNYLFQNVDPGTYYIVFEDPDGFSSTFSNATNDDDDSDITNEIINASGSTTDMFTVTDGMPNLSIDAGYYVCVPIGELVWYDVDGNDIWDSAENGINGLSVNLYRLVNGTYELYSTETTGLKPGTPSDDGYFKFCAPPGTYYVEVQVPAVGLIQAYPNQINALPIGNSNEPTNDSDLTNDFGEGTTTSFTVSSGDQICSIGAGYYPMSSVCGVVWEDSDNNGVRNDDEVRVSGILVEAYLANGTKVGEATTNELGEYQIGDLGKEDVFFVFTPPADFEFTYPNIGGNDDTDSDVTEEFGDNTTGLISLAPGSNICGVDAGIRVIVLPVEWVSISAEWRGNSSHLRWSTASEINNDYYEVERRHKSEAEFTSLGRVEAAGNSLSLSNYSYDDRDEFESGVYYYRIKQVDLDGKSDHSATVNITVDDTGRQINLYPNPSFGSSNLTIVLPDAEVVDVSIYDSSSKLISKTPISKNGLTGINTEIPINNLLKGVYTIHIENDNFKEVKRLIIVK